MNVITSKVLKEMRKQSKNTTKQILEQSKNMEKNQAKKGNTEVKQLAIPSIIVVSFWVMIAFLSLRTLI